MAWTAPMTAVASTAFTAAQFNLYVRDNLNETAPAKATAAGGFFVSNGVNTIIQRNLVSDTINTQQTTASTTYIALTTAGPTCSNVISDTRVLLFMTVQMNNNTANQESIAAAAISGATTAAADDNTGVDNQSASASSDVTCARIVRHTVTPGSNTFTMQYRVTGGQGSFRRRSMVAMPF